MGKTTYTSTTNVHYVFYLKTIKNIYYHGLSSMKRNYALWYIKQIKKRTFIYYDIIVTVGNSESNSINTYFNKCFFFDVEVQSPL